MVPDFQYRWYVHLKSCTAAVVPSPRNVTGVIGTGLFLGTASSLAQGGPVGLLLGYGAVGTVCYSVMVGLSPVIYGAYAQFLISVNSGIS